MFKIGDFSRLGQVSTRMLRHYDKLGLLVPKHVDEESGYSYYKIDQLAQLHRIIALKELGLSLQQITEMMQKDDALPVEELRGMLKLKQAEIEQELQTNKDRLNDVAARLEQIERQGRPSPYEVVVKPITSLTIASIRTVAPHISEVGFYCENLYSQLYAGLKEHHVQPLQPEIAMYHTEEYSEVDLDIEMSVPVSPKHLNQAAINEQIQFRILPARDLMACLIYEGPFSGVPAAALELLAWVGTHDYASSAPMRELRLSGPAHGGGELQKAPVLELQLPVRRM